MKAELAARQHAAVSHARAVADHYDSRADLRAEQARAQRALLREQTADPRTPTPHAQLTRGWYEMEWQGFRLVVAVGKHRDGSAYFVPPTGYERSLESVPDAKFYRLPEELQ